MAGALLRGDLAALRLAPKILRKRAEIGRLRKLAPAEVRHLLFRYRLPLSEVA